MSRSKTRGRRNNNPAWRNRYSDWGVMEMVKERPLAATAAAAGAAAAGLFLWSKRTQIGDQLSNLSDQFSEWKERSGFQSDDTAELPTAGSKARRGARSQPTA